MMKRILVPIDARERSEAIVPVVAALAQSAGKLGRHPTLAGWLYQTTVNKCRERTRSELRRQRRQEVAINEQLARMEGARPALGQPA